MAAGAPDKKTLKLSTPTPRSWAGALLQLYTFRDRTFYEALEAIAGMACEMSSRLLSEAEQGTPGLETGETLAPKIAAR